MQENNSDFYKNELYSIIENNKFGNLPSQGLIDTDIKVALAVWCNYDPGNSWRSEYDSFDRFQINWREILSVYAKDLNFWKQAVGIHKHLLNDDFEPQFPYISQQLLSSKDAVIAYLNKSKSRDYFIHLKPLVSEEEFISIKKKFVLEHHVEEDDLKAFEADEAFVKAALTIKSSLYEKLTPENKLKEEYITTIVKTHEDGLSLLNQDLQSQYLDLWVSNRKEINLKIIANLPDDLKDRVLNQTSDSELITYFVKKSPTTYIEPFINFLKNNPDKKERTIKKLIKDLSIKDINKIFKNNLNLVEDRLNAWIDGLSISKLQSYDKKMAALCGLNKELQIKLDNSLEYNFSLMHDSRKRITLPMLKDYFENLNERINNNQITPEKAEANLIKAKGMLSIEAMKHYRIPNTGIMNYFLHEKLSKEVKIEEDKPTTKRNKI